MISENLPYMKDSHVRSWFAGFDDDLDSEGFTEQIRNNEPVVFFYVVEKVQAGNLDQPFSIQVPVSKPFRTAREARETIVELLGNHPRARIVMEQYWPTGDLDPETEKVLT